MRRHDLYKPDWSCPVSCLSFGENRKTEYPDVFFCHGCDLLEDAVNNGAKRAHWQQKKYMAQLVTPTYRIRQQQKGNTGLISRHQVLQASQEKQLLNMISKNQVERMTDFFLQEMSPHREALARRNNAERYNKVCRWLYRMQECICTTGTKEHQNRAPSYPFLLLLHQRYYPMLKVSSRRKRSF